MGDNLIKPDPFISASPEAKQQLRDAVKATKLARLLIQDMEETSYDRELHEMVTSRILNAERELERMLRVVEYGR